MVSRLVVHIGPGRTGTTALQHAFSSNSDALLAAGVLYPTWSEGPSNAHPAAIRRQSQALGEAVRATDARTVVVSSEFLQRSVPSVDLLTEVLGLRSTQVEIVVTVRGHVSQFRSHLQQHVKVRHDTRRIRPVLYERLWRHWDLHYPTSLFAWAGPDGDSTSIVDRFLSRFCDVEVPDVRSERRNASPSSEFSHIMQVYNSRHVELSPRSRARSAAFAKELARVESRHVTTRPRLTAEWSDRVRRYTAEDLRWLRARGLLMEDAESPPTRSTGGSDTGSTPSGWSGVASIREALEIDLAVAARMEREAFRMDVGH